MKTHISATRPAGLAIAAALVFTPLSLFAQEAPGSVAPVADPAPAAAPPEAAAPAPDPVVEAAAPVAAAEPVTTTTTTTRNTRSVAPATVRTATRTTTASPVVAPVVARTVTTPAPVIAVPVETVPTALPETTVAPLPADEPVVAPEPQRSAFDTEMALILGGLAALALLGWGFVAVGRRRRPSIAVVRHEPVIERPIVATPVAAETMREPIAFAPRPAPAAPSLSHTGAAVALPRELPQSHEAREELLNRMVDAKPDRANPFTSPIQRRKRARLIMQCIGKTFDHPPRIDLSQYPENWPELQTMRYADAA